MFEKKFCFVYFVFLFRLSFADGDGVKDIKFSAPKIKLKLIMQKKKMMHSFIIILISKKFYLFILTEQNK